MVSKGVRCMNHRGSEGGEKRGKMHGQEPHGETGGASRGSMEGRGSEREEIRKRPDEVNVSRRRGGLDHIKIADEE